MIDCHQANEALHSVTAKVSQDRYVDIEHIHGADRGSRHRCVPASDTALPRFSSTSFLSPTTDFFSPEDPILHMRSLR
jgi:hypothetical protein